MHTDNTDNMARPTIVIRADSIEGDHPPLLAEPPDDPPGDGDVDVQESARARKLEARAWEATAREEEAAGQRQAVLSLLDVLNADPAAPPDGRAPRAWHDHQTWLRGEVATRCQHAALVEAGVEGSNDWSWWHQLPQYRRLTRLREAAGRNPQGPHPTPPVGSPGLKDLDASGLIPKVRCCPRCAHFFLADHARTEYCSKGCKRPEPEVHAADVRRLRKTKAEQRAPLKKARRRKAAALLEQRVTRKTAIRPE